MPSFSVDPAYLGQSFVLLTVAGGQVVRVRVVADPPAPGWASVLASGADSGGTSPQLTNGDQFRVLGPAGDPFGVLDTNAEFSVRGVNDGIKGRDLNLYGGDSGPGVAGNVNIGPGSGATGQVNVYDSTGVLRFRVNENGIGFFSTGPVAQPNIVGARGGNVALTNLLAGLSNLGIIRDSTTP